METLGKLFGSESKVRMMRLFLFNPGTPFSAEMVANRTTSTLSTAKRELATLKLMKFVKVKSFTMKVSTGKKGKQKVVSKKFSGFVLNTGFPYLPELQRLLLDTSLLKGAEITKKLSGTVGRLKLVVIAGIFIQDDESRLDILMVGDHLKNSAIEKKIRAMESEIGKELRYAAFETTEFNYRLGLYDKLIRDVLDFPHTVAFDRLGLPPLNTAR
ncbi:MAG: hypothetical protein Q7R64_01765 [bacterium]|nr:hypothetical protein [bacterium]